MLIEAHNFLRTGFGGAGRGLRESERGGEKGEKAREDAGAGAGSVFGACVGAGAGAGVGSGSGSGAVQVCQRQAIRRRGKGKQLKFASAAPQDLDNIDEHRHQPVWLYRHTQIEMQAYYLGL